jgi:tripartite-type tricarboxylate transporter receptor subunit TctC
VLTRLVAERMRASLGGNVIVENRAGAEGRVGTDAAKASAPDGNTLLLTPLAPMVTFPHSHADTVRYDPFKDFDPVAHVTNFQLALVVNAEVPAKNLAEFAALVKKDPRQGDYASAAAGSLPHYLGVMFARTAGLEMTHIPYKGSAPALADMMAGRIQLMFDNQASALPSIKSDKVRALATTTLKRSSFLPDLPTLDESGLKGFDMTTWWGVSVASKTPQPVVDRLSAEILKAMDAPDFRERLRNMGSEPPAIRTPDQFAAFVASELKTYTELVKRSGAKAD